MNSVLKRMAAISGVMAGMVLSGAIALADGMGGMGDMNGMSDMSSGMSSGMKSSSAASPVGHGKGVVKSVDRKAGTVTITHGPIKEFGWSGMTMSFPVRHRSFLKSLKAGDRVSFDMIQDGQGSTVITKIERRP